MCILSHRLYIYVVEQVQNYTIYILQHLELPNDKNESDR